MSTIFRNGGFIGRTALYPNSGIWSLNTVWQNTERFIYAESGLQIFYDASNSSSYPGTGTTLSDLTTNSYNGTLSNITFDTNRFLFDSSSDLISVSSYATHKSTSFTYEFWVVPTATHQIDTQSSGGVGGISGQKYLLYPVAESGTGCGISLGTNGVSVYGHAANYMPPLLVHSATISNTVPTQIVVTGTGNTPALYINGSFVKNGLNAGRTMFGGFENIGSGYWGFYNGYMYKALFYNRVLDATEIQNNFDYFKVEYGL